MADFDWKTFLFTFDGRVSRSDFWLRWILPYWGIMIVLFGIASLLGLDGVGGVFMLLINLIALVAIWPSLAVSIKRLHDRNKSGWWLLLLLIPVVGGLWYLIDVGILAGTPGDNQYGPAPAQSVTA